MVVGCGGAVAEALDEVRGLASRRHLVAGLVRADLRATHTNTVLGGLWWMLSPLLEALTYFFLVGLVFRSRQADFPLFILAAVVPWKCFSEGCTRAMTVFAGRGRLMRQVRFPRSAIIVSWVTSAHLNALFAVPVLVGMQAWFGTGPSVRTVGILALLLPQYLFAVGLTLVLAAVNVHFRDMERLSGFLFRLWFILSPALYSVDLVPARYQELYRLNPFCVVFSGMRDVLMFDRLPPVADVAYLSLVALGSLAVGFLVFGAVRRGMTKVL